MQNSKNPYELLIKKNILGNMKGFFKLLLNYFFNETIHLHSFPHHPSKLLQSHLVTVEVIPEHEVPALVPGSPVLAAHALVGAVVVPVAAVPAPVRRTVDGCVVIVVVVERTELHVVVPAQRVSCATKLKW